MYFLQSPEDLRQPLNHRNEAAAVSLLLQRLANEDLPNPHDTLSIESLKARLSEHCESLWPLFRSDAASIGSLNNEETTNSTPPATFPGPDSTASAFHDWAETNKIKSGVKIASFGGLRGVAAVENISPGEPVLSIPKESLIYDETVKETDLGKMLSAIPDLSIDNLLIIFTLCDRFDPESQWAPFWRSLPDAYFTGLSFPPAIAAAVRGTAAHLEILRGQVHLRKQYQATRPILDILLEAYPQYLNPDWFEYDKYVWAAELWYSYAFEVEFPPNTKSKTAMVPFACHVNHSPWPHVVRYGRLNPSTGTLDYPAFRPCLKGEQVFISYGPVPNMKLLSYYGFAIPGNPHDLVPLTLEPPEGGLTTQQEAAMKAHGVEMEHSLRDGPLAGKLLACVRLVVATEEEIEIVLQGHVDPLVEMLSPACEAQALDTLTVVLQGLIEPVGESLGRLEEKRKMENGKGTVQEESLFNENGFDADWRTSLEFCRIYMEGQMDILKRALKECLKLRNAILD